MFSSSSQSKEELQLTFASESQQEKGSLHYKFCLEIYGLSSREAGFKLETLTDL